MYLHEGQVDRANKNKPLKRNEVETFKATHSGKGSAADKIELLTRRCWCFRRCSRSCVGGRGLPLRSERYFLMVGRLICFGYWRR